MAVESLSRQVGTTRTKDFKACPQTGLPHRLQYTQRVPGFTFQATQRFQRLHRLVVIMKQRSHPLLIRLSIPSTPIRWESSRSSRKWVPQVPSIARQERITTRQV